MSRRWATGILAGLLGLVGVATASAQAPAVTAFVNVSVIPMDRERVLAQQTVLVQGDRILKIGPVGKVRVPANATRVDGTGKYLLPGLEDMHVHLWNRPLPEVAFRFLAAGVTTVRDMLADKGTLALKARIAKGEIVGPRIYTAVNVHECALAKFTECVTGAKTAGYDFIKFYETINITDEPPPSRSDSAALREYQRRAFDSLTAAAARVGIGITGHMQKIGLERALQARVATAEHLYGYLEYATGFDRADLDTTVQLDTVKLAELAAATKRAGTWATPTLSNAAATDEAILAMRGGNDKQAPSRRHRGQLNMYITKFLHDKGVGLLFGTDALQAMPEMLAGFRKGPRPSGEPPYMPGPSVLRELELLAATGLTPYQVLEMATRNPATFLGTQDHAGTVEVKKDADLVLLAKNPLEDLRGGFASLEGVMVKGQWLPKAELDRQLSAFGQKTP